MSFDRALFDFSLVYEHELINFQCNDRRRFAQRAYSGQISSDHNKGIFGDKLIPTCLD